MYAITSVSLDKMKQEPENMLSLRFECVGLLLKRSRKGYKTKFKIFRSPTGPTRTLITHDYIIRQKYSRSSSLELKLYEEYK